MDRNFVKLFVWKWSELSSHLHVVVSEEKIVLNLDRDHC